MMSRFFNNKGDKKMQEKIETITINNVEYVRKDQQQNIAIDTNGLEFCIVRTYSAGVFAGYVSERNGKELTLLNSIRLWKWSGASLSQVSQEGTPNVANCQFGMIEPKKYITEAIEISPCTEKAMKAIQAVKPWKV
jgi:hypothetical protein